MTQAEMNSYRQKLLALKKRLGGDLTELEEAALRPIGGDSSGNLSDVPVHPADLGSDRVGVQPQSEIARRLERLTA